jgi:hypothetical protein
MSNLELQVGSLTVCNLLHRLQWLTLEQVLEHLMNYSYAKN